MKVPIQELASFSKGKQINGSDLIPNGKYDFLNGGILPSGKWSDYNVQGDTVTVSEGGNSCGYVNYMTAPFWCGAHCYYFYNLKVPSKYFYYALKSQQDFIMNLRSGACMPNIKMSALSEFEIPITFQKDTQQNIVANLDKVSALIAFRKQQLAKLDELVKARFVEMFGDPILNDKGWPMATLGEIAEIRIGPFGTLLHAEDYVSGGHALVNPSHIVNGAIQTDDNLTVSDSKYAELSAYQLAIGDIVLGRRGEMGRCAVVCDEGLLCGTGSMIIRPNHQMRPYFLQNIISRPEYRKIIESKAVGLTMMNLNIPIVSALSVPLLPLGLQEDFIAYLLKIDELRLTIRHGLGKMETLKRTLMQEYFG